MASTRLSSGLVGAARGRTYGERGASTPHERARPPVHLVSRFYRISPYHAPGPRPQLRSKYRDLPSSSLYGFFYLAFIHHMTRDCEIGDCVDRCDVIGDDCASINNNISKIQIQYCDTQKEGPDFAEAAVSAHSLPNRVLLKRFPTKWFTL